MISLHLLHCVPQSFKCRTIQWVFSPTVKHNLIANGEKHTTHHYITSLGRKLGRGLDAAWFFQCWTRRADKYFWQGRSPSNIRLWMSEPHLLRIWSWIRRKSFGNLIVLAWLLLFRTVSIMIIFSFNFLELSFPFPYYNSQFSLNVFWFCHSVSFLKFLGYYTGIYIRIWRSTWKKWSYTCKKST